MFVMRHRPSSLLPPDTSLFISIVCHLVLWSGAKVMTKFRQGLPTTCSMHVVSTSVRPQDMLRRELDFCTEDWNKVPGVKAALDVSVTCIGHLSSVLLATITLTSQLVYLEPALSEIFHKTKRPTSRLWSIHICHTLLWTGRIWDMNIT